MKLRILPRANGDLDRLHAFLTTKNLAAANRMLEVVTDAIFSLKLAPERGRPLTSGFRELIVPFGKAAYIVRYRLRAAERMIVVSRIWHSREQRA